MVVYIKADLEQNLKMNTPGVGNKKHKFKQPLGWGKNERATVKQLTKNRVKLSRKLRSRRARPSKTGLSDVSRRKPRRKKV